MKWSLGTAVSLVALCAVSTTCGDQAPNVQPSAAIDNPGQDTTVTPGDAVQFLGSAEDADGTVSTHAWDYGDGNGATVQDPGAYTYAARGTHTVTFSVTDNDGATSVPDTVVVVVSQVPTSTIDNPGRDTTIILGDAVNFQGSAADADGSVVSRVWDFGDGSGATVEDPGVHTYAAGGDYTVTFSVIDDDGATSVPDTVTVMVNQAPTAAIDNPGQDTTAIWPYAIDFQATANDADGEVAFHSWDFGDGNTADVEDPGPYAYVDLGTYTVTYQATDDDGAVSELAELVVTVEESAGVAPEPGTWLVGGGDLLIDLTVNPQGTAITTIDFIFEDWQCGGATRNERLTSNTGWPISDGEFTIDAAFPPFELTMTVQGTFNSSSTASGDWTAVSFGTTCSAGWGGSREPPRIAVFRSADFAELQDVLGFGWVPGRHVTMEIDNDADGSIDFVGTTRASNDGTSRFHEGGPPHPFAVAEGDSIGMHDAVTTVGYLVLYVTLESVDAATDLVSGSARAGTALAVGIDNPLPYVEGPTVHVIAGADESWQADFTGVFDILTGTGLWVSANCPFISGGLVCGGYTSVFWSP